MIKEAKITFFMPHDGKKEASDKAHDLRISFSEFIRQAIQEKIERAVANNG